MTEMQRRIALVTGGLLFTATLGGTLTPGEARSLAEITESNEIRICIVASHDAASNNWAEPEGCRDDCRSFSGYRYDTAMAFVATLDEAIQPKFVRIDWDEQFHNQSGETVKEESYTPELLASGTCDFYPNVLYEVDWRKSKMDLVGLASFRDIIMVHDTLKDQITTPQDLAGKTTAFAQGLAGLEWLKQENQSTYADDPIEIEMVDEFEEVIDLIEAGQIDFIYMYPEVGLGPRGQDIENVATAFSVGPVYTGSWAFRKEDKDLQDAVRVFFDAQKPDPDSDLNQAWSETFKLTLPEWDELMTR